jgi:hypothetical protein
MRLMSEKQKKRQGSRHKDRHTVSIPGEHYEALKALASKHGRPTSWQLRLVIEEAAKAAGLWPPAEPDAGKPGGKVGK